MGADGMDAVGRRGPVGASWRWLRQQIRALPRIHRTAAEWALVWSLLFIGVIVALHVLNAAFIDGETLNLSGAWNVPTVASTLLFLAAAAFAWRAGEAVKDLAVARVWRGVAVVVALLAVEALVNVHAEVEEAIDEDLVILVMPLVLLPIAIVLVRQVLRLEAPVPLLLLAAAALIVLGQVSSIFDNVIEIGGFVDPLLILFEETAEMLSPALVLTAAVFAARESDETAVDGPGWLERQLQAVWELRGTRAQRDALLGVAFVAVISGLHLINAVFIEGELLNFSGDWNVPTFATGLIFVVAGASCLRTSRALGREGRREARAWLLIGAIVGLLGVEAVINLHGELESISGLATPVLVAIPILGAIAVAVAIKPLLALRAPAPLLLLAGGTLLVATQALAAVTGNSDLTGPARRVASLFQEGGEMLSACFVLAAAAAAVDSVKPGEGRPDRGV